MRRLCPWLKASLWATYRRWIGALRVVLHNIEGSDHNVLRSSADRLLVAVLLPGDAGSSAVAGPVRVAGEADLPQNGRIVTVVGHAEHSQCEK